MSKINYKIRKLYVSLNPLLSVKWVSDRIQWIMRNSPLIDSGIPFFLEPYLNPDDLYAGFEKRKWYALIEIFFKNFWYYTMLRFSLLIRKD